MIKTLTIHYETLNVTASDIESLIGYMRGNSPDGFNKYYEDALRRAAEVCRISAGYRLFSDIRITKNNIRIEGTKLSTGRTIARQLKNSSGIAIFVCTAGGDISDLSKQMAVANDGIMAYLFDVIGSVCAEKSAGFLEALLLKELGQPEYGISKRCSPGYCGWDVAEQHKLFALLPENFCGVTVSETSLMIPIKSVSGIIGYGTNMAKSDRPCTQCNQTTCIHKFKHQ